MESPSPKGSNRDYVYPILKAEVHEAVVMLHGSSNEKAVKQLNNIATSFGQQAMSIILSELFSVLLCISDKNTSNYKPEFDYMGHFVKALVMQVDAQFIIQAFSSIQDVTVSLSFSQFVNMLPIEVLPKALFALFVNGVKDQPFKSQPKTYLINCLNSQEQLKEISLCPVYAYDFISFVKDNTSSFNASSLKSILDTLSGNSVVSIPEEDSGSIPPIQISHPKPGIQMLPDLGCVVSVSTPFLLSVLRTLCGCSTMHLDVHEVAVVLIQLANTEAVEDISTQILMIREFLRYSKLQLPSELLIHCWDVPVLVSALKQFDPQLDFLEVFNSLDCDDFLLSSSQSFAFLHQIWTEASLEGMIGSIVCKPWTHQHGQSQMLQYAINFTPNVFSSLPQSPFIIENPSYPIPSEFAAWTSVGLLNTILELMESSCFEEIKSLLVPMMTQQPLLLFFLLLVSESHTFIRRFLLEQLLYRILSRTIAPSDLTFLRKAVDTYKSLVVELIESFMRGHEEIPSSFLMNINELNLQEALLMSEHCTVFNHIFVKNFTTDKQTILEPILIARIDRYGMMVLTTMLSFIQDQIHNLEHACSPVLSLLQFIDHLQHTSLHLSQGQFVDVSGAIQALCEASTLMKKTWEDTVKQQADAMFKDLFRVPRSSDTFCASIRKLRHSPYYFDVQVYHIFLTRLLSELTIAIEGSHVSGDSTFAVTLAGFVTSLFVQRVLEEEEHDTLESFVTILKKYELTPSGMILMQKVLPSIRFVVQDHHDIDTLLKPEYARFMIQPSMSVTDSSTSMPVMPLRNMLSSTTPSFSDQSFSSPLQPHYPNDTVFPEFQNCVPLSETVISNIKRVMNQLGGNNMDRITQRLFSLIQPTQYASFAQFFVDGYVLRQPQYLDRYLEMILSQKNDALEECMLDAAIIQSYDLVKSPDTSLAFLKSAGSFIGSFTLQRDRVLPLRKLNLYRFLDECINDGSLKNCLPFVTQIMRSCMSSTVLCSYHQPWVHSILVKLISIEEDTTIPSSIKSRHIVNMLDVFQLHGEVLEGLKNEAIALHAPVSASPSLPYLQSVPSYPSTTMYPGLVPSLQPAQSAPGLVPTSLPSTPGMSLQQSLSLQNSGYIRQTSLSPHQPSIDPSLNDSTFALFQDCFFHVLGLSLSLQQRMSIQSVILSHFHQMQQKEFPSLLRALLVSIPERREQRTLIVNSAVEELLAPQYDLLHRSFAKIFPQVDVSLCLAAYSTAVKQTILRQIELFVCSGDSVLSTINELNTQSSVWNTQRNDSVSFVDVLWGIVTRTTNLLLYYMKTGQNALSPVFSATCQHFVLEVSSVLSSQPLKTESLDIRYAFLLDYLSRVLTESPDPTMIPRQTLTPYLLSTYDQVLGVSSMVALEAALKRCLIKPDTRLNVLFVGRLVKEQVLPAKVLDDGLVAVLSATPPDVLEGSSIVVAITNVIQQLMITRHRLFTNQLPSTIRKSAEVSASASENTPRLLELKMVLLRLQRRYEVLVQESAYLSKFSSVLRAWLDLCSSQNTPSEEPTIAFIVALKRKGLLQSETQTVIALRLLFLSSLDMTSEIIVPASVTSEVQNTIDTFTPIHGFVSLAISLFKYTDPSSKSSLLLCILTGITSVLTEEQKNGCLRSLTPILLVLTQIQQTILEPFICQLLPSDDSTPDPSIVAQATDLLRVFLYGLQLMQPSLLPSFSFIWITSFSNITLIRLVHLLSDPIASNQYRDLLLGYVRFLSGLMSLETVPEALELHYKALTSLLLHLYSMWPDLLSTNYGDLCLLIPSRYIQLRNIICSAVPTGITMFSPREAMSDRMTKCLNEPTKDTWDTSAILSGLNLTDQFATYRATANPVIMNDLARNLPSLPKAEMVYALLYEVAAATYLRTYPDDKPNSRKSFPVDFYTQLLKQLQPQLRPSIVMSLLDHVRYPSFDTYTFCMLMKTLMGHDYNDAVFACICERMLVPGPKPWGLEFLFSQLVNSDPEGIRKLNCYSTNSRVIELFNQYYSLK